MQTQTHGASAEHDVDFVGPFGSSIAAPGLRRLGAGGKPGEQSEGDRRQGNGVELDAQLGDALAGGGERCNETLILRGQTHRLGARLAQLVADEIGRWHAQGLGIRHERALHHRCH